MPLLHPSHGSGPSAAVVGLAVFVGLRHRAYVTAGAVVEAMVVEVLVKEDLAGGKGASGGDRDGAGGVRGRGRTSAAPRLIGRTG
ncbi:hypothetical protein [Streptomyces sp. DSM 40750]|uniref:hypothetical protein n=1 Tax=Streptomyces sp. DSM 40750 TaxID=2801030 RepID=UPI003FA79916